MASGGVNVEDLNKALGSAKINDESVRIDSFSEIVNEVTVHFQIIRLPRQVGLSSMVLKKKKMMSHTLYCK